MRGLERVFPDAKAPTLSEYSNVKSTPGKASFSKSGKRMRPT